MITAQSRIFSILCLVLLIVISSADWGFDFQEQKVLAPDGAAEDWFGNAVALEGDTALVGSYVEDVNANDTQGSAYVFTQDKTGWFFQQKLTASDGEAGDRFGKSVALYGDTALVGAYTVDVNGIEDAGSAYVFVRNGTTWSQQAKLTAPDATWRAYFGHAVAIFGDTALVGAYLDDIDANGDQGSAYVFTRSGTNWSLQQKLSAQDGSEGDHFGFSVALSGDTALVGARYEDIGANAMQGSAYLFTRSGTLWNEQAQLIASDGAAEDMFGANVALSGNTAFIGATSDDIGTNSNQGSAYLFTCSGGVCSEQAHLIAMDGAAYDFFGSAVALSGETALVGANGDDVGSNLAQGSIYLFQRDGVTWAERTKLTASEGAQGDNFGISVALSGDDILVGAFWDDIGESANQGSVYFYNPLPTIFLPFIKKDTP